MERWIWIVVLVLVLAAGVSLQVSMMARRMRGSGRKSLRARRAEMWRRREAERDAGVPMNADESGDTTDER